MGFIKLHDAEIQKLATGGPKGRAIAGDGWALYCCLRRRAWEQKAGEPDTKGWRRYFSFPSQTTICKDLGWEKPAVRPCGNVDTSQKVTRAVKKLELAGLIKVIGSKNTDQWSKRVRAGLGRSAGRGHVYHLVFWEEVVTGQKRHVSRDENDMCSRDENDMCDGSKTTCKKETFNPSVEEKNNNISIKEMNRWEWNTVESKQGLEYTKGQILELLQEDFDTGSALILSAFTIGELETISGWMDGWKETIELKDLHSAVMMKVMGS